MDTGSLIDHLRRQGLWLDVNGDQLIVKPASRVSAADAERIRTHKVAIVAALRERGTMRRMRPVRPMRPDCVTCGKPLRIGSALRCSACVDQAYRERAARWETEDGVDRVDRPA